MSKRRHSWHEKAREQFRTVRACSRCSILKITRHDGPGIPWTEFEVDGLTYSLEDLGATPKCVPARGAA